MLNENVLSHCIKPACNIFLLKRLFSPKFLCLAFSYMACRCLWSRYFVLLKGNVHQWTGKFGPTKFMLMHQGSQIVMPVFYASKDNVHEASPSKQTIV